MAFKILFNSQIFQPAGCLVFQQIRCSSTTSFLTTYPASFIWKGVTGVSSAGRKRGRAKGPGAARAKDLNKGQQIGVGPNAMIWPGLNAPIVKGKERIEIQELPKDDSYEKSLMEIRNQLDTFHKHKVNPLQRGWTGGSMHGQWSKGKDIFPDEEGLRDFICTTIHSKLHMLARARVGKLADVRLLTIIGNRNGCIGLGKNHAGNMRDAIRFSYQSAARNCISVPIYDGHTIWHDFHSRYGCVKVYAFKMPPGYGLVCHRVVRDICIAVGIKDIMVKVEGNLDNYLYIARAFISGLFNQKTFQEMADGKRLHVVEFREETGLYPKVMASPKNNNVKSLEEIEKGEYSNFHMYVHEGKVLEITPKKYPAWVRTLGYGKHLLKYHYVRNKQYIRCRLRAKYGTVESFLTYREKEERKARKMEMLTQVASEASKDSSSPVTQTEE